MILNNDTMNKILIKPGITKQVHKYSSYEEIKND